MRELTFAFEPRGRAGGKEARRQRPCHLHSISGDNSVPITHARTNAFHERGHLGEVHLEESLATNSY